MTQHIKAIETVYNGYRFRSRLEARWAVFFDTLGIKYEYEKEGFDLGDAGWYLPDFWLPDLDCWVEIKGQTPEPEEMDKCAALATNSGKRVFLFPGQVSLPVSGFDGAFFFFPGHGCAYDTVPREEFTKNFFALYPTRWEFELYNGGFQHWYHCTACDRIFIRSGTEPSFVTSCSLIGEEATLSWDHPRLLAAYTAARQARFEHGETPTIPTR